MSIKKIIKEVVIDGNLHIPTKYINLACYYVLPGILLVMLFIPGVPEQLQPIVGSAALWMLCLVLFVKPFAVFLPKIRLLSRLVGLRRQLGLATFILAAGHVVYLAHTWGQGIVTTIWNALKFGGSPRYAALALILLIIISLSSVPTFTQLLKRWWKRVQRLSYLVLPLVLLHAGMNRDELWLSYTVMATYVVLKGIEWGLYIRRKRQATQANTNNKPG
jgi:DMSO/TMAO reductase YedYZ heme-binding membrane subunit